MIGIKTTLTIVVVIVTISLFSFANMALAARRTAKDAAQQAGDEGAKKTGCTKGSVCEPPKDKPKQYSSHQEPEIITLWKSRVSDISLLSQKVICINTIFTDPNPEDKLTYSWKQIAGPTVVLSHLSNSNTSHPTFIAPSFDPGNSVLTFQLIVNDGTMDSKPDTVSIIIEPKSYRRRKSNNSKRNLTCNTIRSFYPRKSILRSQSSNRKEG